MKIDKNAGWMTDRVLGILAFILLVICCLGIAAIMGSSPSEGKQGSQWEEVESNVQRLKLFKGWLVKYSGRFIYIEDVDREWETQTEQVKDLNERKH